MSAPNHPQCTIMSGLKMSEADRQKVNPKFLCSKCDLLLTEPMQTPCGHLMCQACVQILFSSSNPVCPKDGTNFKEEEVFLDAFTKRELLDLHLHCPNPGCELSMTYKELKEHLNVCDHSVIQCVHSQCKQNVKRALLAEHLKTECLHRQTTCTRCKKELAFNLLKEHIDIECLETPLVCKYCGITDIPRKDMTKHETVECEEIPTECEFKAVGCDVEVVNRKELRVHQRDGLVIHNGYLLRFVLDMCGKFQSLFQMRELMTKMQTALDVLKQTVGSLSNNVKTLSQKFVGIMKMTTGLERRVEVLESRAKEGRSDAMAAPVDTAMLSDFKERIEKLEENNRKLEDENREKTTKIARLEARVDQVDHSMALTTVQLSEVGLSSGQSTTSYNGILLWRIDDFSHKREDAVSSVQTAIYSPAFYTSQFGYKMCARIYLNGDGFGKETHISLFFVVMKGEYDSLLPWPFQKKITMMMLDQSNGDHMIDAFRSDPESSSFQRPTNNMNIASGSPLFMPLDGLNNRAYVKDDAIFIKIIVD